MAESQARLSKDRVLGSQPPGSNFKEPETCPALPSLAKPEQQKPETTPDLPLTPSGQSTCSPHCWAAPAFSRCMDKGYFPEVKRSPRHAPYRESESQPASSFPAAPCCLEICPHSHRSSRPPRRRPGNANHSNTLPDLKEKEKSEGRMGARSPPSMTPAPSTYEVVSKQFLNDCVNK